MDKEVLKMQMAKGSEMIIEKMASIANCSISEIESAIELSSGGVYKYYVKSMTAMACRLIEIQG